MAQEGIELGTSVGYALKRAATALRVAMEEALAPLGLTVTQYSTLELLGQRPGLSASALARGTFVTRQSMQTVLAGLVDRGLVTRPSTAPHGRTLPTRLTAEGEDLRARASDVVAAVERRMLDGLPPGGEQRLLAGLVACTDALDRSAPTATPGPTT